MGTAWLPESSRRDGPANRARNARPIVIENRVDEQPIVRRRAADMAPTPRKQILDPIPFIIPQSNPDPLVSPSKSRPPMSQRFADSGIPSQLSRN